MRDIQFEIPGLAVPWARAGRKGGFSYTPKKQADYMAAVRIAAQAAMGGQPPLDGPVMLSITVVYPWPASMSRKKRRAKDAFLKATRPDLSNHVKLIEDALNGITYRDDGQVAILHAAKRFDGAARVGVYLAGLSGAADETSHLPDMVAAGRPVPF